MSRIVCKFGGSSVADHLQFLKIKQIVNANPQRKVIVPSAPGKRNATETKLTDLFYLCQDMAQKSLDFSTPFALIKQRYLEIEKNLGLTVSIESELDAVSLAIQNGSTKDFVASRGEYLCGILMANFLGAEFVDPKETVFFDKAGRLDVKTYEVLGQRMHDVNKIYVLPGFYGVDIHGQIKTFSRGGSDISGAIAARAVMASLYENWTDVSGLLMADPRVVKNPEPIDMVSYKEIRELSYMGASVFHDEAIAPVRDVNIPINIKNTNKPEDIGTLIVAKIPEVTKYDIAGIAGKKNFSIFSMEKAMMNKELGFARRVLGIFENHGINIEHCPSGIDTLSVVVSNEEIADKAERVREDIQRIMQVDKLDVETDLALIATVGEGMSHQVGMAAKVFCALRDAKVNIRIIDQGSSELNIIVGVNGSDYEKAIHALYKAFVVG